MEEEKKFLEAVEFVNNSQSMDIDNNTKLQFYALFKQATIGNCNIEAPYMIQIEKYAKWNAWNQLKNKDSNEAKIEYVSKLKELKCGF